MSAVVERAMFFIGTVIQGDSLAYSLRFSNTLQ